MHWGINPLPLPHHKSTTPSFCQDPIKSENCPSPTFFKVIPPYILVFHEPLPLKIGFFSKPPIKISSLTLSHLLKVTKFLAKISRFKFLVITEKNMFVYKLLLSLNISDFSLFSM